MSNLVQLRLPEDRARQLRNLAEAKGVSLSGAVGELFKVLYRHTEAQHDIPSIKVNAFADGLAIQFPKSEVTKFSLEAATQMAALVREYVAGDHAGEKTVGGPNGPYAIWRKGNAIKIAIPMNAPEKNFTRDLAEEFAELLENEIAKANVT